VQPGVEFGGALRLLRGQVALLARILAQGRFDFTDGSPQRKPVCVALPTYPVREHDGKIFLQLRPLGENRDGVGRRGEAMSHQLDPAAA
jgi:hypothetical protein